MAKYTLKKIRKGPDKGKWGVYRGKVMMMTHGNKGAAVRDATSRKDYTGGAQ